MGVRLRGSRALRVIRRVPPHRCGVPALDFCVGPETDGTRGPRCGVLEMGIRGVTWPVFGGGGSYG